jgi:hypothetical protein
MFFHGFCGYANVPQCYITCTLLVLLNFTYLHKPLHVCMYRMNTCSVNGFDVILPRMEKLGIENWVCLVRLCDIYVEVYWYLLRTPCMAWHVSYLCSSPLHTFTSVAGVTSLPASSTSWWAMEECYQHPLCLPWRRSKSVVKLETGYSSDTAAFFSQFI